ATRASVPFLAQIPADAQCGVPLNIEAESVTGGHTFRGFAQVTPGLKQVFVSDFEHSMGGFAANRAGTDTASNGWQYGAPTEYGAHGWTIQPGGGHQSTNAWFTGLGEGHRPYTDSSLGVGSTTLMSLPFDVSTTYKPVLQFWAWYQAIDIANKE